MDAARYLKLYFEDFLNSHDIDISDRDYKKTEQYQKVKDDWFFCGSYGFMSTEEIIERFLLTKEEVIKTYDSKYAMGNPYELDDKECEVTAMALDIVKSMDAEGEADIKALEQSKKFMDIETAKVARRAQDETAKEIAFTVTRKDGGYVKQIKSHLNLDLGSFDNNNIENKNNNIENKREIIKILHFVYLLKDKYGPKILELFCKPSMENIDYSFINLETFNGNIMRYIKQSLGKELLLQEKIKITESLQTLSLSWDELLRNTIFQIETTKWHIVDITKIIESRLLHPLPDKTKNVGGIIKYRHSPIETLYLKILQHEYLSYIEDMVKLIDTQTKATYSMPEEFTDVIKSQNWKRIPIDNVEKFIHLNAISLANIIWYDSQPNKNEYRLIRNNAEKVRRWINFCIQERLIVNVEDTINELLIISCLQAFILYKDEEEKKEFNSYTFPLYQRYMKHMPTTQVVIKSDEHLSDAKQIYWIHKVLDRLYANAGMLNVRRALQDYVKHCYGIMKNILQYSNIEEMLESHEYYINYLKIESDKLIALDGQLRALLSFEQYLNDRGFQFIDDKNDIRYIFTCSAETTYIRNSLISYIELALVYKEPVLHVQMKTADKKYLDFDISLVSETDVSHAEGVAMDFKFIFDYQNQTCTMSEFKLFNGHNAYQ